MWASSERSVHVSFGIDNSHAYDIPWMVMKVVSMVAEGQ